MKKETTVNATRLWTVLARATNSVAKNLSIHIQTLGICDSDFAALEALLHKGPLAVNEIGSKVLLTSGSMTASIDRLEKKGFVERHNHPTDRRSNLVHLTSRGKSFIEDAFRDHEKVINDNISVLTQQDMDSIYPLLKKLGLSIESKLNE
ncbi:MAG: MarR family transcriptional regulator [Candidatus Electryonea clarkiae]|nr:MarR family transcriptional regulator [Candidatus Electryonea clarkiae]MDP8286395.1 MarR family transcriptional regulator [Candidatus Electryonea clarkiae]